MATADTAPAPGDPGLHLRHPRHDRCRGRRGALVAARHELALRILQSLPTDLRSRVVASGVNLEDLPIWHDLLVAVAHAPSYLEPVGRSDLLLVRQTTTGYRRAEIGYIENILVGETANAS